MSSDKVTVVFADEDQAPEKKDSTNGGSMIAKYKGRSYKIRIGRQGGQYILVNNKKIYIRK